MITPQDIKKQCSNWWKEYLVSITTGETFFPKEITRIGKITAKEILSKLGEHKAAIAELQRSAAQWGFTLKMREKNFEKIGSQLIPDRIIIPSANVYLSIVRQRNEVDVFSRNWQLIRQEMPQLVEWCRCNPNRLISHNTWKETLSVCRYFLAHPRPNLYIRELPIDIHTKYIEEHKELIRLLLDVLLPTSSIRIEKKNFEERYGLKSAEPLIRIRFLDAALAPAAEWTDISLPLSTFRQLNIPCRRLFITENKMNFLTLPPLSESIAVWSGGGFNISYLKDISWLSEVQSYYWGDLDAQGLQILNQFRTYHPSAISLFMNWETFHTYRQLMKGGTPAPIQFLPQLTEDEQSLYRFLQENNLRLEQERIPQKEVLRRLEQLW